MDHAQILSTIGTIYDTALNPGIWPDALEQTADVIGAKIALLGVYDPVHPEAQLIAASHSYGNNAEGYLKFQDDPQEQRIVQAMQQGQPQTVHRDTDTLDSETLQSLPITQWMIRQLGVLHRCGTLLCKHRGWIDGMVFAYDQNRLGMSAAEEQQLQWLLPHLARAVEIQRPFSILRRRFNAVMSVLDRLHIGVAILYQNGEVVLYNKAAERIFDDDDGLGLTASRRFLARNRTESLYALIDKVIATANIQGHSAGEMTTVSRASGKTPYILEIAPLRDSQQEIDAELRGSMVFIIDPERPDTVSVRGLTIAYRLSEAEQAVCQHLINGLNNDDIAEQRGVGPETVKSQVSNILHKTQTRSRAELIHLALKISPPIDP